jgi:3-oxoacyl-[acyl-carrier-protein] synthase-3
MRFGDLALMTARDEAPATEVASPVGQRLRPAPRGRVAVAGWGTAIPEFVVTNHDWAQRVDTSDAWIVERTGIRERRWVGPDQTTASMAIQAGAAAIKRANLSPADIGMCIVATCTPEQPIPATASFVQDGLGLRCGAFDVDAACAGFVYALVVGAGLVFMGGLDAVLVIGSATMSRVADPEDRSTCVLFGDGAAAVVLVPEASHPPGGYRRNGTEGAGLLAWDLGCDGSAAPLLAVPAGGSRLPASRETVAARLHFLKMEGQEVFRRAVRAFVDSATATLGQAGVTPADVDLFVPHQANARIIRRRHLPAGHPPRAHVHEHRPPGQYLGRVHPDRLGGGGRRRTAPSGGSGAALRGRRRHVVGERPAALVTVPGRRC